MIIAIYHIYQLLSLLAYPFLFLLLKFRLKKGKEDPERWKEKLGFYTKNRPEGNLIWFHVASVGEMNSIKKLVAILSQKSNVIITSMTLTSAKNFFTIEGSKFEVFHQFVPLDSVICVRRFLEHFKPNKLAILENEIWPNMIYETSKVCNVFSLNTSFSPKSIEMWNKMPNFLKWIFGRYKKIFPASKSLCSHLSRLGVENVSFIGNLKYDSQFASQPLDFEVKKKIICFGSVHLEEMESLMESLKEIAKRDDYQAILIPRYIEKVAEIKDLIQKNGLNDSILIVDKMGKSLDFYAVSSIVIVCGSFAPIGGHNIIEPAFFGKPVIMGNYHFKCTEVVKDFLAENAVLVCDSTNLKAGIVELIENEQKAKEIGQNAFNLVQKNGKTSQIIASFF